MLPMEPELRESTSAAGCRKLGVTGIWPEVFDGAGSDAARAPGRRVRVLLVDDVEIHLHLVSAILRAEGYAVETARDAEDALARLRTRRFDLAVLSANLPALAGYELCLRIRAEPTLKPVPVLMLAGWDVEGADCLAHGADDVLERPFTPTQLRWRIQSMLRERAALSRLEESEAVLFSLAVAVEQRDPGTAGHCERLALYSVAMGMRLELPSADLRALYRGGFLHDIGKVGMPDSILFKPGPLAEDEWALMRTHTLRGEQICAPLRCLDQVQPVIRSHHERWNGTGYPDALRGDRIPLLARILQFADVFDALTTVRPYKPALSIQDSLRIIQQETRQGWHDPELLPLFLELKHEQLRELAFTVHYERQDLNAMKESLANLRVALG
jgi:putative two-component system response regulator